MLAEPYGGAMLINFSNHPSEKWGDDQTRVAVETFGPICDIKFPAVDPGFSSERVLETAEQYAAEIISVLPDAVLCQGEFSLAFAVTALLLSKGIKVVCACSEREVDEETDENGTTKKTVKFKFTGFREYLLPTSI